MCSGTGFASSPPFPARDRGMRVWIWVVVLTPPFLAGVRGVCVWVRSRAPPGWGLPLFLVGRSLSGLGAGPVGVASRHPCLWWAGWSLTNLGGRPCYRSPPFQDGVWRWFWCGGPSPILAEGFVVPCLLWVVPSLPLVGWSPAISGGGPCGLLGPSPMLAEGRWVVFPVSASQSGYNKFTASHVTNSLLVQAPGLPGSRRISGASQCSCG